MSIEPQYPTKIAIIDQGGYCLSPWHVQNGTYGSPDTVSIISEICGSALSKPDIRNEIIQKSASNRVYTTNFKDKWIIKSEVDFIGVYTLRVGRWRPVSSHLAEWNFKEKKLVYSFKVLINDKRCLMTLTGLRREVLCDIEPEYPTSIQF